MTENFKSFATRNQRFSEKDMPAIRALYSRERGALDFSRDEHSAVKSVEADEMNRYHYASWSFGYLVLSRQTLEGYREDILLLKNQELSVDDWRLVFVTACASEEVSLPEPSAMLAGGREILKKKAVGEAEMDARVRGIILGLVAFMVALLLYGSKSGLNGGAVQGLVSIGAMLLSGFGSWWLMRKPMRRQAAAKFC